MMWGKHKENGIWIADNSRWSITTIGGDRIIYIAAGRLRLRLMKP